MKKVYNLEVWISVFSENSALFGPRRDKTCFRVSNKASFKSATETS